MHRSSSNSSIYSILVSLSLCIALLHTTQYIQYCFPYQCASLFFKQLNIFYTGIFISVHHSSSHNSIYSALVSLSVCITLLHATQYILYYYHYHCASLFFKQFNIFFTCIFISVHHSSSLNSIYSIMLSFSLCIILFIQLNIFNTAFFISVHHSSSHSVRLYWYLYHCVSLFITQLKIFCTGIFISVHHSTSHNSIYSILLSLPLCTIFLPTAQYILYCYLFKFALHFFTVQYILYCYFYNFALLFFTQLNIFYTTICAFPHHSSSHNSID